MTHDDRSGMACTLFVVYASQMMSFPSWEAETRCLRSVLQCIAYIFARCPLSCFFVFIVSRGSTSTRCFATSRTTPDLLAVSVLGAMDLREVARSAGQTYELCQPVHPSCVLFYP